MYGKTYVECSRWGVVGRRVVEKELERIVEI